MNSKSEQILEAVDILLDEKISGLQFDKTIQATVQSIKDLDSGEYKVEYKDGIISAFSADPTITYKKGDVVYVTIPEGDFSKKKFITHRITKNSLTTSQYSELANTIFEISPDFSRLGYEYRVVSSSGYGLTVGNNSSIEILLNSPDSANMRFKAYSDQYDLIQISALFLTEFIKDHTVGNYGIEVVFTNTEDKQNSYFLNLNDFNGDPYHLNTWSPQSAIIQIPKGHIKKVDAIRFFENGFEADIDTPARSNNSQDTLVNGIKSGAKIYENKECTGDYVTRTSDRFPRENDNFVYLQDYKTWEWTYRVSTGDFAVRYIPNEESYFYYTKPPANLFMKDLKITFIEKKDLTDIPYYLNIVPIDGIAFTEQQTELTLEGHVYHSGEELPSSSCIFKWFEKDLSVEVGSDNYDKRAGIGWKEISNADKFNLTRTKQDVLWKQTYKLVVVYNSSTLMTQTITLINGDLEAEIKQIDGADGSITLLLESDNNYVGDWFYLATNGEYVKINNDIKTKQIVVTNYLLYSPMSFYCSVYNTAGYLGDLVYVIQSMQSEEDVSVVFSGDDFFNYDANGDINIYDAEIERYLQIDIIWKKGINTSSCKVEWLDYEDEDISSRNEEKLYGNDSMLGKVRVDSGKNILYYTVKHKFKIVSPKNNTFRIRISTQDGQVYTFSKEIVFTKTGDPGTNGTKYQSLIKRTSNNQFVHIRSGNDNQTVELSCKVYNDSDLLPSDSATIKWTLFNLGSVESTLEGSKITVYALNDDRRRYAKATITIKESNIVLYDFFPVDSCASQFDIDLSELPKYIQYSSNGRNPQFRKQVPTIVYGNSSIEITSPTLPDGKVNPLSIDGNNFKPLDEFDPENSIGLLQLKIASSSIFHPVPMYINTFGNEAINGWDGVSVDIDTNGGKILAPQVGAGTKDQSTNTFTGVVMGKDSAQQKVGLYGYQAGVNSFGLTEEGKAYFGVAGKGRITIDGTSATISGGGGGTSTSGMTITLSAAASDDDAIRVGKDNFIVTYGGKLTAKSAVIDGTITAGAGSKIGGWTLAEKRLYSGSGTSYVALDSGTTDVTQAIWAGKVDSATAPFRVTRTGNLTATSADITGIIKANTGYIGGTSGWIIDSNKIYGAKNNKYVALSTQGNYALFAGASSNDDTGGADAPFWVKFDGSLQATAATIQGKITAIEGAIGNWKINSAGDGALRSTLSDSGASTRIYLNGNPESGGNIIEIKTSASSIVDDQEVATNGWFYVTDQGKMVATNAEIHGTIKSKAGELGGWTINNDGLKKADDIYIYSNGSMKLRNNFAIDTSGNVSVKGNITATAGYIGWQDDSNKGWAITANKIYSNSTKYVGLASNGNYAIWAGDEDSTSAPFSVTHTGKVIATDIEATGKITANSGRIAGWVISDNKLQVRTSVTDTTGSTNLYLNGGPWADGENQYVIYMSAISPSADTEVSNTNGRFYVTTSGHMFAQSAEIRGTITSKAGSIGTWNISNKAISTLTNETTVANNTTGMARSGFNGYVQVDDKNYSQTETDNKINNIAFWSGMNYVKEGDNYYLQGSETGTFFAVTHGGKLYCRSANIKGTITANSGTIGGWKITSNRLQNEDGTVYLSASGGLKLGNNFSVSSSGVLSASGATISGNITASEGWIGNWKIANNRLQNSDGSVYLGTNGFKLGSNFSVNSSGELTATGASISGSITMGVGSSINWNNVSETGTVPYDEAGDAATAATAALNSAKSYTDTQINALDIPVLPEYIKSTKIYEARIESPTIVGGEIYAATFYAVAPTVGNTKPSYLSITSQGLEFYESNSTQTQYQNQWNLYDNGSELSLWGIRSRLNLSFEYINMDTAAAVILPNENQIFISKGSGSQSLVDYIEDHAGTAVFG